MTFDDPRPVGALANERTQLVDVVRRALRGWIDQDSEADAAEDIADAIIADGWPRKEPIA